MNLDHITTISDLATPTPGAYVTASPTQQETTTR